MEKEYLKKKDFTFWENRYSDKSIETSCSDDSI